jgi:hypothetical protein
MEEAAKKSVKSAGNTPLSAEPQRRKNREVEKLLTLAFGPGKTPFPVGF